MRLAETVTLIAATITVGLMAGLFVAFSVAVMPGLARVDHRTFVETMQKINIAIVNGWFLVCFIGALVVSGVAMVLFLIDGGPVRPWIVAAFALYALTIGITGAVNIPLNNQLDAAGPVGNIADVTAIRERFEAPWVRANIWRSVANLAAFGCLTWALIQHGQFV